MPSPAARRPRQLIEPHHAVTYDAPEGRDAYEAVGLRGFWRGYLAGRAAPLGPVGPGVVTACFFGFRHARRDQLGRDTDRLAIDPTERLEPDQIDEPFGLLRSLAAWLLDSGTVAYPHPIGVPAPSRRDNP